MKDIIVIVGPTGVGKTKLSLDLAKKLDAEIINGDSVSVYKHLNIGSAKVTIEERKEVPHHLVDICELKDTYSVYDYQRDARKAIDDITSRGKRVIVVGGTGLYIKSVLYDYHFTEETSHDNFKDLSNEEIYTKVLEYDRNCDCHVNNRQRLVRLLNKYQNDDELTNGKNTLLYPIKVVGLTTDRKTLYDKINNRVDRMLDNGLLKEIESLKDFYKTSRVLNTAIGYKEFYSYLYHGKRIDRVIEDVKLDSRRYAKRQYTFFNHQFAVNWFDVNFVDFSKTINEVYEYLKKNRSC